MICPKCGYQDKDDWKQYLGKQNGRKIHFFSNTGSDPTIPKITRTRLYFKKGDVNIRAALELVAIEHRHDPYFRWSDCPTGSIDEILR